MTDVTWYRLSERAPTKADADELGNVMWSYQDDRNSPRSWQVWAGPWNATLAYMHHFYSWRRLTAADYPPKQREPRKVVRWIWWPPVGSRDNPESWSLQNFAVAERNEKGGHIQRVEIVEELPEGER